MDAAEPVDSFGASVGLELLSLVWRRSGAHPPWVYASGNACRHCHVAITRSAIRRAIPGLNWG